MSGSGEVRGECARASILPARGHERSPQMGNTHMLRLVPAQKAQPAPVMMVTLCRSVRHVMGRRGSVPEVRFAVEPREDILHVVGEFRRDQEGNISMGCCV